MSLRRGLPLVLVVLLVGTGSMLHFLPQDGSYASLFDREEETRTFVANFSATSSCVLWANSTQTAHTLRLGGARNAFDGCVQSNREVSLVGSHGRFNGSVRYVTRIHNNGAGHIFHVAPLKVQPTPYPATFSLLDYAPGGIAAAKATQAGKYYLHAGSVTLNPSLLREGLHFVDGSATVDAKGLDVAVTLVATGSITVRGDGLALRAYTDGLVLHSAATGPGAMALGGGLTLYGVVYAPDGDLHVTGSRQRITGQLLADTVQVSGSDNVFKGRSARALAASAGTVVPYGTASDAPGSDLEGSQPSEKPAAGPMPEPAPPEGADAPELTELPRIGVSTGDFDGDGNPDLVLVVTHPLDPDPLTLHVHPRGFRVDGATRDPWEVIVP